MAYRKKNGDLDMRYNDSKKKAKRAGIIGGIFFFILFLIELIKSCS